MKFIITENKVKNIIHNYLDRKIEGLIPYESVNDYHPNEIFYINPKNGRVIFSFNKRDGKYYFDYSDMFKELHDIFTKTYYEVHDILKDYFIDKFGYRGFGNISTAVMPSQGKYVWRRVSNEYNILQKN